MIHLLMSFKIKGKKNPVLSKSQKDFGGNFFWAANIRKLEQPYRKIGQDDCVAWYGLRLGLSCP